MRVLIPALLALTSCTAFPDGEPPGPPHPANNRPAVVETRANAQHSVDNAVQTGAADKVDLQRLNKNLQPKVPYDTQGSRLQSNIINYYFPQR
jgi:hypothetical protein